MVKCDKCGNETISYYEDEGRKLCFGCYYKKDNLKGQKLEQSQESLPSKKIDKITVKEDWGKTEKKGELVSNKIEEKWTVLTKGTEEIWTHEKVEKKLRNGKIIIGIGLLFWLPFFILYIQQLLTDLGSYGLFDTAMRGSCNSAWWMSIIALLLIIYGRMLVKSAERAKEIYEMKKNKT